MRLHKTQALADARRVERELPSSPVRTMLVAAILAGAAVPSQTLARLGITIPFDWRRLNRFQAAYPVRLSHDEDGNRLPRLPFIRPHHVEELDEEI